MPATYYPAIIDRSASGFGATFPDFAGCVAAGATIQEAALNAEAALALHIEAMVKDKDDIPAPSTLDDIEAGLDGADDVACVLVRADVPTRVERVLVSLDAGLLRAIDAVASNRSAWLADAARLALAREQPAANDTVYRRIEAVVAERPGLSEAELAKAIFGPQGYQQQVNADCRWLVRQGRVVRTSGRPARYYAPDAVPEGATVASAA